MAKDDTPISIGDIFPGHRKVLYFWSRYDLSDWHFERLKKVFRVSADELDSVRLRFPTPHYLRTKYYFRFVLGVIALALVITTGVLIASVYLAIAR
jgi:hypothetical protein